MTHARRSRKNTNPVKVAEVAIPENAVAFRIVVADGTLGDWTDISKLQAGFLALLTKSGHRSIEYAFAGPSA